jgi:hypothetical protein
MAWAHGAPFLVVDTHRLTLTVLSRHDRVLERFGNIAIGSGGAARLHVAGDDVTPRGDFRVAWIDRHSRFGEFFGLDYPTPRAALRAWREGRIGGPSLRAIVRAFQHGRLPPQDTALGGDIGIHGLGEDSPAVQRHVNWTDGCIALSNRQLRRLARWVHVGTRVMIR